MRFFFTKPAIVAVIVLAIIGAGVFVFFGLRERSPEISLTSDSKNLEPGREVIGKSVEGRDITAYTYGSGGKHIIFVGGIHGGYEWNSVLLAYQFMDYLDRNSGFVPENLTVTVIPSANPDGLHSVIGKDGRFVLADVPVVTKKISESGRFNANEVDLNRNFDCNWKSTGTWKSKTVSAGTAPFSEPEAVAIRNFVLKNNPRAVIFWHSQANAVYASECNNGILPETLDIMNAYSRASGYPAVESFDSYEVNGDSEGWLASQNIPAITVELKTHETTEWDKNLAGIKAILGYYGNGERL